MNPIRSNVYALIPARGGSKTVLNKNIKPLNGKPLIQYTIEAALKCNSIKKVIVSTDSKEIADIAKKLGVEVPFLRPSVLAQDNVSDLPVVEHAINKIYDIYKEKVSHIVFLRPTTPFKTPDIINSCLKKMLDNDYDSLRSVTKVEGIQHPYWMYKESQGKLESFIPGIDIRNYYQRQLLPDCYRLNGVVDIIKPETISEYASLYGSNVGFCEIEERNALDIDTQLDFEIAEFLINKQKNE